ncbi:Ku protein, partial [Candidatus Saccharibacteria bacterium]|nr:Ku protein [Candidatus Saccharibacteria bacterium]
AKDIEPIFFDKTYYIEPEEGAEKSYALLRDTLARTGRVPLAKIVFKEKEHIAAIMTHEDVLTLHTLFYADEIASPGPGP